MDGALLLDSKEVRAIDLASSYFENKVADKRYLRKSFQKFYTSSTLGPQTNDIFFEIPVQVCHIIGIFF